MNKAKWTKRPQQPPIAGEYIVYRAENDRQGVTYWNGEKWGDAKKEDKLVTHWTELLETPED